MLYRITDFDMPVITISLFNTQVPTIKTNIGKRQPAIQEGEHGTELDDSATG